MEFITGAIVWLIFAAIIGSAASKRGRSGFAWFVLAVIFSPLLTVIALLLMGKPDPNEKTHKKCSQCAEWCAREALVCRFCGARFSA